MNDPDMVNFLDPPSSPSPDDLWSDAWSELSDPVAFDTSFECDTSVSDSQPETSEESTDDASSDSAIRSEDKSEDSPDDFTVDEEELKEKFAFTPKANNDETYASIVNATVRIWSRTALLSGQFDYQLHPLHDPVMRLLSQMGREMAEARQRQREES